MIINGSKTKKKGLLYNSGRRLNLPKIGFGSPSKEWMAQNDRI